jgi:hypothetical protein
MFLFNEVEEHDDVTDNHTYKTHDSSKCHEPDSTASMILPNESMRPIAASPVNS